MAQSASLSAGYFPSSFPRDPVDVNIYTEHVLLGQILEPLVASGVDSGLEPAVAESWTISPDSKSISFRIAEGLKFSNGRTVTSRDVKYTLDRHIQSERSQAKSYLRRITSIQATNSREVIIELDSPYVAIMKALSRDQLGIVPEGWTFDASSNEPFIGTGPYRAVRNGGTWRLVANPHYRFRSSLGVDRWDLIFIDPSSTDVSKLPIPDVIPVAVHEVAQSMRSHPRWSDSTWTVSPLNHFTQTSAFWYPHGRHFNDRLVRARAMNAMNDLIGRRCSGIGCSRTTGIIPQGIPGYLTTQVMPQEMGESREQTLDVHISVVAREYSNVVSSKDIAAVESQHNVRFRFTKLDLTKPPSDQPDIIVYAYAGGFHDPEGFLTVITTQLRAELPQVLQELTPLYVAASREQDWSKRHGLYQELNRELVRNHFVVPCWKPEVITCHSALVHRGTNSLSYTPKLKDYSRKENNHGAESEHL